MNITRTHLMMTAPLLLCLLLNPRSLATLSIYVEPERLAARASIIVQGRVTRCASGYDQTRDRLSTYISLDVERVHRGPDDLEQLVIREPGGRFGTLVNHVDAVPTYEVGETVLVFLETAADGALRTSGMFFGKFTILDQADRGSRIAVRDLEGQGRILGRAKTRSERFTLNDLVAVAVSVTPQTPIKHVTRSRRSRIVLRPPEYDQLAWDPGEGGTATTVAGVTGTANATVSLKPGSPAETAKFELLSSVSPSRWMASDSGTAVAFKLDPDNDPLGDTAAATALIETAMAAWTNVPESRVSLQLEDPAYDYTGTHNLSPATNYYGEHVVLFDDPYDDITDPSGCSGVLAIGGYWRTNTLGATVNGVDFYPTVQSYVIFNNGFDCFLGDPDNLAEVATHELGHTLGFGHSTASDALMRSAAYSGRGPRLGDDDRDIAHCTYPHSLVLNAPNGGEEWSSGEQHTISWSTTAESGPDAGEVALEYSTNDGSTWQVISSGTPNDGTFTWSVPDVAGTNLRVRVLRNSLAGDIPEPFSTICSSDLSNGSFSVLPGTALAGSIGNTLLIDKAANGELRLNWDSSCSADVDDHALYQGLLSDLTSGVFTPLPESCSVGPDLVEYITPANESMYFLVAPLAGVAEGSLGNDSSGNPRNTSGSVCATRESASVCN